MNKQKETKKGEQAFNKQFLNRLARSNPDAAYYDVACFESDSPNSEKDFEKKI
jgi:hypothetical protein